MERVLQVIRSMEYGGAETFIMNLYRNMDREKIQFDFLVNSDGKYDEEIRELGGKIYKIPYITEVGQAKYVKELKKFFKNHPEYQIIHSHIDQVSGIIVETANKCDIKKIISHSHNTKNSNGILGKLYKSYLQSKINKNTTDKLACGIDAAKWLYKKSWKDAIIINNGIDIDKFRYNEKNRQSIRKSLGIEKDTIVIGHVGRFSKQKNHKFLLDIFYEFQKNRNDSILLLVGNGKLKKTIEKKARKLKIENKVIILSDRNDTYKIYSAFDIMVFPSLFEGLSVALIEAQCNGLKVLASNNIDKNTDITGNIFYENLNNTPKKWAEKIESINLDRNDIKEKFQNSEYDIKNVAKRMENIYLSKI
mgnify:FL=1